MICDRDPGSGARHRGAQRQPGPIQKPVASESYGFQTPDPGSRIPDPGSRIPGERTPAPDSYYAAAREWLTVESALIVAEA